jgi:hypothetical protein
MTTSLTPFEQASHKSSLHYNPKNVSSLETGAKRHHLNTTSMEELRLERSFIP